MNLVNIDVRNVDVDELREQRDWLLNGCEHERTTDNQEGLISLLNYMLDRAEGHV